MVPFPSCCGCVKNEIFPDFAAAFQPVWMFQRSCEGMRLTVSPSGGSETDVVPRFPPPPPCYCSVLLKYINLGPSGFPELPAHFFHTARQNVVNIIGSGKLHELHVPRFLLIQPGSVFLLVVSFPLETVFQPNTRRNPHFVPPRRPNIPPPPGGIPGILLKKMQFIGSVLPFSLFPSPFFIFSLASPGERPPISALVPPRFVNKKPHPGDLFLKPLTFIHFPLLVPPTFPYACLPWGNDP